MNRNVEVELAKPVVFIGEAPSRQHPRQRIPQRPGRSSRRIVSMLGTTWPEFRKRCGWVNLLPRWPGKQGKGDGFDEAAALVEAQAIVDHLWEKRGSTVLFLLGLRVAEAFGASRSFFDGSVYRMAGGEATYITFPHPSGVSRWWNAKANREAAAAMLRRWVEAPGEWPAKDLEATIERHGWKRVA
jgi:hypothetical protein